MTGAGRPGAGPAAIAIVTPAPRGSRGGNRVTALRWARLLRQLGHRPFVETHWSGRPASALIAVHARKSAGAVAAFAAAGRSRAAAVVLAGTDIYPDFRPDRELLACLQTAHRIVALQPEALHLLPTDLANKTRVIVQSATALQADRPTDVLQACVLAHLRAVKDPLLPFDALALVGRDLPVRIVLAGRAIDAAIGERARRGGDPRGRWVGELRRRLALRLLAESHVCIVPSLGEGGANVLSEAIAAGTPPLATAIPGNTGLLGLDWPGLFAPGDARALAALLVRVATDPAFRGDLQRRTERLQPLVDPGRERQCLADLLGELGVAPRRLAAD